MFIKIININYKKTYSNLENRVDKVNICYSLFYMYGYII